MVKVRKDSVLVRLRCSVCNDVYDEKETRFIYDNTVKKGVGVICNKCDEKRGENKND